MIRRFLVTLAATAVLSIASPTLARQSAPAPAPSPPPPDVAGAAALLKLYSATAAPKQNADNATLNIATTGTRSQVVYVSGAVFSSPAGPVREVYSFVAHITGPIDPALALRLLVESDRNLPSSSWAATAPADGSHYIVYEAYIPTTAGADQVQSMVTNAAMAADKLEAELSLTDTY